MLYLFFAILLTLFGQFCFAAELTLERALQLGWANHPDLQISHQEVTLAEQAIWLEKEDFRPQAHLRSRARYAEDMERLSMGETLSVKSTLGTEIAIIAEEWVGHDERRKRHNHKGDDLSVGLSVTQPLLKGRTKAYNTFGLNNATIGKLISEYQYQVTEQTVLQKIIVAYRALQLATLNLNLQAHLLQGTERLAGMIDKKIEIGKMPEIEGAHIKLQVQKERVALKQIQDNTSLAWLKFWEALGVEPEPGFDRVSLPHDEDVTSFDKGESIEKGMDYDLNLKIWNLRKQQAEQALQKAREDAWWDLDLKLESNLGTSWDRPFNSYKDRRANAAQLQLKVPLTDKRQKLKIENHEISLRKINLNILEQKRKIQINVETLWKNLDNLRMQKQSSKEWLKLAQESLSLSQKKFELGRSSMMEVMHYTDQLQLAEIQYTRTAIAVLNAKTDLDVATGQLLEVWRDRAQLD
ncbi:MAG: TolC family protein [Gammaproteobacteria bacterium]